MNYKTKIILILFVVVLVGGLLSLVIKPTSTGSIVLTDEDSIGMPSPRIINVHCVKQNIESIRQIKVITSIKNYGGGGKITIIGSIDAVETDFSDSKSKTIYMNRGQTEEVIFYFDLEEYTEMKCSAKAFVSNE